MFSHMAWGAFSAVADEATHSYPHCLFVKCHSTFSIIGVIAVGEVALHVVHPGWRMSSISAVADEAAHCSQRRLFERCHGLTTFSFGRWVASSRLRTKPSMFPRDGRLGNAIADVLP